MLHETGAPPPGAPVTVNSGDLQYLLAHYWDEIRGEPDRSHWRLPLLKAAAMRLSAALTTEPEEGGG